MFCQDRGGVVGVYVAVGVVVGVGAVLLVQHHAPRHPSKGYRAWAVA